MNIIATILATLGIGSSSAGSQACHIAFFEEAECPKSLIK